MFSLIRHWLNFILDMYKYLDIALFFIHFVPQNGSLAKVAYPDKMLHSVV